MIYYGKANAAADWFEQVGFPMPYGVNSADFILDLASGDVESAAKGSGENGRTYMIACSEEYLKAKPRGYQGKERITTVVELARKRSVRTGNCSPGPDLMFPRHSLHSTLCSYVS